MDSITRKRKLEPEIDKLLEKILPQISSETMEEQYHTWCETRDESSRTPREFHAPIIPFTESVDNLLTMFQQNLRIIKTLMTTYINKHCKLDNELCKTIEERLGVIITLESDLENDKIGIYNSNPSDEDLKVFVNTWFHKILEILRDNQPYINDIQLTLPLNKIQFIPIPENTTDGKHILILFFLPHGTHGNNYPSLLAVPLGKNICKTTLTLPGCVSFNSPSQLNEIMSDYEIAYGDRDIQDKLQENFVDTFTDTNKFLKNPILQKITGHLHPTASNPTEVAQIKYKTWCNSLRSSTSSLMLQTRYNEYIKNKTYGIFKNDPNRAINNIYVLLDTSGRFNPGDKLIDYELTFSESSKSNSSITLQEILNIFYANGWDDIGIIDNTCDTGNTPVSHIENFPGILSRGLPHIRGGSRKRSKRYKNKKSKKIKRNKRTRRKNKNHKK
jgi:hypothetical protein